MNLQTNPPLSPLARFARRLLDDPPAGLALALFTTLLIAGADYLGGYALRLNVFYLAPVAMATWAGGLRLGLPLVALASAFCLVENRILAAPDASLSASAETLVMGGACLALALLLNSLRRAQLSADARFRDVLEELQAIACAIDEERGEVLYTSPALARLLAAGERETTDATTAGVSAEALTQRFGIMRLPAGDTATGAQTFSAREARDPGDGRWYLIKSGHIPWAGRNRVALHVLADISDQKLAQATKRQHQETLHQTSRLSELTEVASSLAHELNQPLMAITSYADACLRLLQNPSCAHDELVGALQKCREQALRAGRIISRIRSFIRSKRPTPGEFDMNDLILESVELLESARDANAIRTRLALYPEALITYADRTLLAQVILNLLQNAIEAMEQTPVSERLLTVESNKEADGSISIAVGDCGSGIPEYLQESAYVALFSTKPKGLGLGLSICRSVIEAHGGRLWHEPRAQGGCLFHVTLPQESAA